MSPARRQPSVRARAPALALFAIGLAAVLAPPPARAAVGLSIGWQDCRAGGGPGFANQDFGCLTTINEFPLFPGFVLASAVDSVIAMELVIDLEVAADPMPDWWRMDPGQCREGGFRADVAPAATCSDAWNGQGVASVQGYLFGTPGGSSRHARLLVAAAASPPGTLAALDAGVPYSACRVVVRTNNTLTCAGCSTPACLVFNSLLIRRGPSSIVQEILFSSPETPGLTFVHWQGGAGADCQAVPVRRQTWGAVKALYR